MPQHVCRRQNYYGCNQNQKVHCQQVLIVVLPPVFVGLINLLPLQPLPACHFVLSLPCITLWRSSMVIVLHDLALHLQQYHVLHYGGPQSLSFCTILHYISSNTMYYIMEVLNRYRFARSCTT